MRIVIGAPHGRSGKTLVTMGLILALQQKKGLSVQPFKKGPDFIDPSWLGYMAGRPCRNLDLYFLPPEQLRSVFIEASRDADIAVVEGAMGLYDGLDLEGSDSTAAIARTIASPVVLVIDATRMTRSAAAIVQGFQGFEPDLNIAGVILNKVARPRHEDILRNSIESYTGIPVIGAIPKQKDLHIADRHLGLIPAVEMGQIEEIMLCLGETVAENTDLDAVLSIAGQAAPLQPSSFKPDLNMQSYVRIAVVKDRVFSFYYPENLEALQRHGAELIMVNSLEDTELPDVDALYIGGGFPEVYAQGLQDNVSLRQSIRRAAAMGLPVYAECGGLMYLARRLFTDGKSYEMVGVLPCDTKMNSRPKGHGYSLMQVVQPNYLFAAGTLLRGHEFHHSHIVNPASQLMKCFLEVKRGYGLDGHMDGIVYQNVIASYNHLYAPGYPEWAANFVARAAAFKQDINYGPGESALMSC